MRATPTSEQVVATIAEDLERIVGSPVDVRIEPPPNERLAAELFPGTCLDDLQAEQFPNAVEPSVLTSDDTRAVDEALHSHLLRSVCPVTGQPDIGSVLIRYRGPAIDRGRAVALPGVVPESWRLPRILRGTHLRRSQGPLRLRAFDGLRAVQPARRYRHQPVPFRFRTRGCQSATLAPVESAAASYSAGVSPMS